LSSVSIQSNIPDADISNNYLENLRLFVFAELCYLDEKLEVGGVVANGLVGIRVSSLHNLKDIDNSSIIEL
jgi:hypothetical protein